MLFMTGTIPQGSEKSKRFREYEEKIKKKHLNNFDKNMFNRILIIKKI